VPNPYRIDSQLVCVAVLLTQAFRHLYVLATEARCVEAVDVDTWEPVYVPLHISVHGDAAHAPGTFQRVTPCLLPERGSLARVVLSSPRYWPQDVAGAALEVGGPRTRLQR
jgi:anaphase-promoting complex subunit 1